tara:strand:- start:723 stop:1688 length:966 start_codon:yes stop_codon:yes gene_type:complete
MKSRPILIVSGDPKSVFFEIFIKSIKLNSYKCPLILISSSKLLKLNLKKYKCKKSIRILNKNYLDNYKLNNKKINLIDIDYKTSNNLIKNRLNTNTYIKGCFDSAFDIIKSGYSNKLINGPINKSTFLNKKYLGLTEYISKKFKINNTAMLIYNKDLSVCPLTTHLPLRLVSSKINKKLIGEKIKLINVFFTKYFDFKPKIAVSGLNPHCESILKFNEDDKIIRPAIKSLKKKGFNIHGPFSADTIFLKQNRAKYNVILGMYHDQVLSPIKTLKEYDAINITLGLPFFRISPDHGPNEKMINKNLSNPLSLIRSLKFLDKR